MLWKLKDMQSVFEADSRIGIIERVGYETVSAAGIMWYEKRVGEIYQKKKKESYIDYGEYSYSLPSDGYTCVAVADGLLMATAYNLSWNIQELKYFDFYDAFQSVEFQ